MKGRWGDDVSQGYSYILPEMNDEFPQDAIKFSVIHGADLDQIVLEAADHEFGNFDGFDIHDTLLIQVFHDGKELGSAVVEGVKTMEFQIIR